MSRPPFAPAPPDCSTTTEFFVGAAIAGAGFGAAFQGALRTVFPLARPHERAGPLSAVFVASYVALGVPAMVAGLVVTRGDLIATTRGYTAVVLGLATDSLSARVLRAVAARRMQDRELTASECGPLPRVVRSTRTIARVERQGSQPPAQA